MLRATELPRPEDVLLLVEVSESTYLYDAGAKLRAYARNGIPEYWIVNISKACVEVFRGPVGENYSAYIRVEAGDKVALVAFPDREIVVSDILP